MSRLAERVSAVRRFNRRYTQRLGLLDEGHLESAFSLAEVRILYELAHGQATTAASLVQGLGLDPGYVSRILRRLEKGGLVAREASARDGRVRLLRLTKRGEREFGHLDARAADAVGEMLRARRRTAARPGDMGWIVERHGAIYAEEYGWNSEFEALVARIVADFMRSHDAARERCWIAELEGKRVGSVLLVRHSGAVAKLRILFVEPAARGHGIGTRLVDECVQFARRARYRKIALWTNDVLVSARRIYQAAGFTLVHEEPHRSFGKKLVGQTWEMDLGAPSRS